MHCLSIADRRENLHDGKALSRIRLSTSLNGEMFLDNLSSTYSFGDFRLIFAARCDA